MGAKERLQDIFREVFDDDSIELFDEMTAEDIDDWDSLTHMELIENIENEFGIKLTTAEAMNTANVGDFIKLIEVKIAT